MTPRKTRDFITKDVSFDVHRSDHHGCTNTAGSSAGPIVLVYSTLKEMRRSQHGACQSPQGGGFCIIGAPVVVLYQQAGKTFLKGFIASAYFVAHSDVRPYSVAHPAGPSRKRSPGFARICIEVQSLMKGEITKLKTRQLSGALARSKPQLSAITMHSVFRTIGPTPMCQL